MSTMNSCYIFKNDFFFNLFNFSWFQKDWCAKGLKNENHLECPLKKIILFKENIAVFFCFKSFIHDRWYNCFLIQVSAARTRHWMLRSTLHNYVWQKGEGKKESALLISSVMYIRQGAFLITSEPKVSLQQLWSCSTFIKERKPDCHWARTDWVVPKVCYYH